MKTKIIALFLLFAPLIHGQSIPYILEQIEENNATLAALRGEAEAEKIGNKTGLYPENPEVEYSYQWGNKVTPGDKTTLSVMQSIDFPTAYYHKKKVSDGQNRQVDLRYRIERKNVLLEAHKLCIELTFVNASCRERQVRLDHAQQLADAYQAQFDKGNVNIVDLNKARFNLLNSRKQLDDLLAEKNYLLAELSRYNGGQSLDYPVSEFPQLALPRSFDDFFNPEDNLALAYYRQQILLNKESEKLQRSMNLPRISVGYVSEKVQTAEHFQGAAIGLSIPLFENKNTVKQIKARTQAVMAAESDELLRYRNQTEALYNKAQSYIQTLEGYDEMSLNDDMVELLEKSLSLGQISLIDYLQELSIYYEMIDNRLELERNLHLTIAEMEQWML